MSRRSRSKRIRNTNGDSSWRKTIEQQRLKYNLIGIMIIIIIAVLATNAGGCADNLSRFLIR